MVRRTAALLLLVTGCVLDTGTVALAQEGKPSSRRYSSSLSDWLGESQDIHVLGVSAAPSRLLLARLTAEDRVELALFGESQELLESESVSMPWAEVPQAYGQWPIRSWLDQYALEIPLAGPLLPLKMGFVYLEEDGDAGATRFGEAVFLYSSLGVIRLERVPSVVSDSIRIFFDRQGSMLVLTGRTSHGVYLTQHYLPWNLDSLTDRSLRRAMLSLGDRWFDEGRWEQAVGLAELADRLAPSATAEARLCLWLAHLGQWDRSQRYLERVGRHATAQGAALYARLVRHPVVQEGFLRTTDFSESDEYSIELPPEIQGMTLWLKFRNGEGKTAAALKFSTMSTWHRAEVFAYQMGKLLGVAELFPATMVFELGPKGRKKFKERLGKTTYKQNKEKARLTFLHRCERGKVQGALKMWVKDFQFTSALGKTDRVKALPLGKYIQHTGGWPEASDWFDVRQQTRYYGPESCRVTHYTGRMWYPRLSRDFVDMLVVDVLFGNTDRFPGGNVFFRSLTGGRQIDECTFDLGDTVLFSLDNGSGFVQNGNRADHWFYRELKVSRFSRRTYERLKALNEFLEDRQPVPAFVRRWGVSCVKELRVFLALDEAKTSVKGAKHPFDQFRTSLAQVVQHMARFETEAGAWFPGLPPDRLPL